MQSEQHFDCSWRCWSTRSAASFSAGDSEQSTHVPSVHTPEAQFSSRGGTHVPFPVHRSPSLSVSKMSLAQSRHTDPLSITHSFHALSAFMARCWRTAAAVASATTRTAAAVASAARVGSVQGQLARGVLPNYTSGQAPGLCQEQERSAPFFCVTVPSFV